MPPATAPDRLNPPGAAAFRAQHRGGGLYSELISQRAGSWLALAGHRLRLSPTTLTLAGLVFGVGSSIALVLLATRLGDTAGGWMIGLAVGLGWQVAYAFDCADGQLARVTRRTSNAGARLDILCDVAVQISLIAAIVAVTAAHAPSTPALLYAIFAGTWMVNLVTSLLAAGPAIASLVSSRSPLVRMVKLARDYGAVIAVCALIVTFAPDRTPWLLSALSILNGSFLIASIIQAARASSVPGVRPGGGAG
jgi:phosphatidylglycerophosphate synthase